MTTQMMAVPHFMFNAFVHIWPYLLITIPIAVAVNMSGASAYIRKAFDAGPVTAVFLATLVGAFSPFCSCGVIPVIAALLIGGVPLAPVMAFWIASPSMDPEIFFLSVGTIGWDLAVWRLAGTLGLSLGAGYITHVMVRAQWIGPDVLKHGRGRALQNRPSSMAPAGSAGLTGAGNLFPLKYGTLAPAAACCAGNSSIITPPLPLGNYREGATLEAVDTVEKQTASNSCGCNEQDTFWKRLLKESRDATLMVIKFMALAFFLEALIILYLPEAWVTTMVGQKNGWAILTAAFLGIPVYTSNLSALPMVGGLLVQGMSPGAALAFLIAGPTTTLPAMAAVWTLVKPRVFWVYVSFSLFGAIALGYLKLLWE